MVQNTTALNARIGGKDYAVISLEFSERLSEPFVLKVSFVAPRLSLDDLLGEEILVQGEKLRLAVTLKNSSKGSNEILKPSDEGAKYLFVFYPFVP